MTRLMVVGLGGFLGAVLRYGLSGWIQGRTTSSVPWGTMGVNVLGCLVLGALMAYAKDRSVNEELAFFLRVGLLGAFTTFSTLGYETVELFGAGRWREALLSLGGNLLFGGLAVVLGAWVSRWQFG